MHGARSVVAGPGADVAGLLGDCGTAGCRTEGGVPGAVLAEQRRHVVIAAAIEPEAIFGEHLADRILLLERAWHRRPPSWQPPILPHLQSRRKPGPTYQAAKQSKGGPRLPPALRLGLDGESWRRLPPCPRTPQTALRSTPASGRS